MLYFINPKKSTRRAKRGKLRGAAKVAFLRRMAKGRKKKLAGSIKRARPTRVKRTRRVARSIPRHGVSPMAAKRRKRARKTTHRRRRRPVARKVTRRRRRRVAVARRPRRSITFRRVRGSAYVRNPGGLSVRGAIATLKQGVKDAAAVVAGEAAVNFVGNKVAGMIPGEQTKAKVLAVRAALAIGVGMAAQKVAGRDAARFAVAGALAAPIKGIVFSVLPADVVAQLGDDDFGLYPSLGGYVDEPARIPAGAMNGLGSDVLDEHDGTGMIPGIY